MRVPKKNSNGVPQIACPKCKGEGHIPLSAELMEVLVFVRKNPDCAAPDARRAIDPEKLFHVTAFNNRLNLLHGLGLVQRYKHKGWRYTATC